MVVPLQETVKVKQDTSTLAQPLCTAQPGRGRFGRYAHSLGLVLLFFAVSAPGLLAQTRTRFVFHYYVDPIYGDDGEASARNPGSTSQPLPLSQHSAPASIPGYLQHAPYSFRTVTAAISHITTNLGAIPWTNPDNSQVVDKVVIHCLPGLYGPLTPPLTSEIDASSGLPWNGETFPITLPDRVSIQGTSTLDTIFDAREFVTHVFAVRSTIFPIQPSHQKSFIAHVQIRGARSSSENGAPNGAGIFIDGNEGPVDVLIHNCMIVDNHVGIAIADPLEDPGGESSPVIVNNTIAWNWIGIWSGDLLTVQPPHVGHARPRILNNLIDTYHPAFPSAAANVSCFEGVHRDDLEVFMGGMTYQTFNAWEGPTSPTRPYGWGNFLTGGQYPPGWPVTTTRAPIVIAPIAGVADITPITLAKTSPPQARGTLYVNDLFRNHGYTDLSPHDFRLSYYTTPTTAIGILVDQGARPGGGAPFINGVSFRNGRAITQSSGWGFTTGTGDAYDLEFATMNVESWDGEGFGNIRGYLRMGNPGGTYSNIDYGADDLADLIMAGYIPRTRIFSMWVPNGPIGPHSNVYFVDAPNRTVQNNNQAPRPLVNGWIGESWTIGQPVNNAWWYQAQANPNPPAGSPTSNYTDGVFGSVRRLVLTAQRGPFTRNLRCDFAPSVLLSLNPLWAIQLHNDFGQPTWPIGVYACNPWCSGGSIPGYPTWKRPDNGFLYYNPSGGGLMYQGSPAFTQAGILNSPGSYLNPSGGTDYLDPIMGTSQFGPWGGGPARTYYETNTIGPGDSIAIDPILNSAELGLRYNCQVQYSQNPAVWSNLQTFLGIWMENPISLTGPEGPAQQSLAMPAKDQQELLKKVLQRLSGLK
ncbi:MAG: hypothetical protein R3F30_08100 [Planctomycetota bacterium]